MFATVDDGSHAGGMRGEDRLGACCEIDTLKQSAFCPKHILHIAPSTSPNSPPNIPIQTPRIRIPLPLAKTNVQNRRPMLIRLQQSSSSTALRHIIQINILIPRCDEQAQRRRGCELDRGDGVGGRCGELELGFCGGGEWGVSVGV